MAGLSSSLPVVIPQAYRRLPFPSRLLLAGGAVGIVMLILLSPPPGAPTALLWTRMELTFASSIALVAALLSLPGTVGRIRRVRTWISAAIGLWLVGEIVRNVEVALGSDAVLSLSHLPIACVLLCAVGAYVSAVRGQLGHSDEVAVYLDGAIVFFATASLMLIAFGARAPGGLPDAVDLVYAVFFLATTGATLLLDLAVRAERRPGGAYVLLIGMVLLGAGFLWRVAEPASVPMHGGAGQSAHLLSLGVFVVMLGTITWTDAIDRSPGYVALASRLRTAMPLMAIGITPILIAGQFITSLPAPIEVLNRAAVALILLTVAVRQSVLLRDRETAVGRERDLGRELAAAEAKYRALVESQPGVVYVAEPGVHGRWHYVSPQIERMLGFPAQEWLDDPMLWARQLHPDDRAAILDHERHLTTAQSGGLARTEYRLRAADGTDVWVIDDESVSSLNDDGTPALVQGVLLDITDRKHAEQALQASDEQTRLIIETASYSFIGMDADGRVIDWNQRATDTFGWPRAEAAGRLLADLIVPPSRRAEHVEGIRHYLATGEGPLFGKRIEVAALHRDGHEFPVELTIWPIHIGDQVRFNALVDDITVRKGLEDQLRHQALHDPLTGLPNRTLFVDRVEHALERARRAPGGAMAVLFLDLDDFKAVNDSLGHDGGDRVLVAIADRMRQAIRTEDTAARLSGDEFAILLEDASPGQPATVAARLLGLLSAPVEIDGVSVSTEASIGIAISGEHGTTPDDLLRNADLAMYLAKTRGKNRHELYESGMREAALRRLSLKQALERAVDEERLEVHYQPIVALADGSITGVEALLRWREADGRFVPAPEIIAIAEETGLILPIGRFVMGRACRDMRRGQDELGAVGGLDIAINISVTQLEHGTLLDDVTKALNESGLPAASLVLEITESALSTDSLGSVRTIRSIRSHGIRLALDDFGTGYSSLARLRRFPVDIVKIDRSFVTAMMKDREGVIVQSIIDLGHSLDMQVVAEGIETQAQLLTLRGRGADLGQGYYFAKPMDATAVAAVLAAGALPLSRVRRPAIEAVPAHDASVS